MQSEIKAMSPNVEINILGVNEVGYESGNAAISAGRQIPWLQETAQHRVWLDWNVTLDDVVILDEDNKKAAVYNLTYNALAIQANYDSLKSLLLEQAQ